MRACGQKLVKIGTLTHIHTHTHTTAAKLVVRITYWYFLYARMQRMGNRMRKSPTECRAGGRTGRVSGVLCHRKMNVEIVQNSGKTSTGVRGRDMDIEEGRGK